MSDPAPAADASYLDGPDLVSSETVVTAKLNADDLPTRVSIVLTEISNNVPIFSDSVVQNVEDSVDFRVDAKVSSNDEQNSRNEASSPHRTKERETDINYKPRRHSSTSSLPDELLPAVDDTPKFLVPQLRCISVEIPHHTGISPIHKLDDHIRGFSESVMDVARMFAPSIDVEADMESPTQLHLRKPQRQFTMSSISETEVVKTVSTETDLAPPAGATGNNTGSEESTPKPVSEKASDEGGGKSPSPSEASNASGRGQSKKPFASPKQAKRKTSILHLNFNTGAGGAGAGGNAGHMTLGESMRSKMFQEAKRRAKETAAQIAKAKEEQYQLMLERKLQQEEENRKKLELQRLEEERIARRGKAKGYGFSSIKAGLRKKDFHDTIEKSPLPMSIEQREKMLKEKAEQERAEAAEKAENDRFDGGSYGPMSRKMTEVKPMTLGRRSTARPTTAGGFIPTGRRTLDAIQSEIHKEGRFSWITEQQRAQSANAAQHSNIIHARDINIIANEITDAAAFAEQLRKHKKGQSKIMQEILADNSHHGYKIVKNPAGPDKYVETILGGAMSSLSNVPRSSSPKLPPSPPGGISHNLINIADHLRHEKEEWVHKNANIFINSARYGGGMNERFEEQRADLIDYIYANGSLIYDDWGREVSWSTKKEKRFSSPVTATTTPNPSLLGGGDSTVLAGGSVLEGGDSVAGSSLTRMSNIRGMLQKHIQVGKLLNAYRPWSPNREAMAARAHRLANNGTNSNNLTHRSQDGSISSSNVLGSGLQQQDSLTFNNSIGEWSVEAGHVALQAAPYHQHDHSHHHYQQHHHNHHSHGHHHSAEMDPTFVLRPVQPAHRDSLRKNSQSPPVRPNSSPSPTRGTVVSPQRGTIVTPPHSAHHQVYPSGTTLPHAAQAISPTRGITVSPMRAVGADPSPTTRGTTIPRDSQELPRPSTAGGHIGKRSPTALLKASPKLARPSTAAASTRMGKSSSEGSGSGMLHIISEFAKASEEALKPEGSVVTKAPRMPLLVNVLRVTWKEDDDDNLL